MNGGQLILGRKRLGKRKPLSLEPRAAVAEVEHHCLGHAERQRQLHKEEHDQGDVGRSAYDAKECPGHDRAIAAPPQSQLLNHNLGRRRAAIARGNRVRSLLPPGCPPMQL